jgi:hypothetical protein
MAIHASIFNIEKQKKKIRWTKDNIVLERDLLCNFFWLITLGFVKKKIYRIGSLYINYNY